MATIVSLLQDFLRIKTGTYKAEQQQSFVVISTEIQILLVGRRKYNYFIMRSDR